jgi:hypothetical protein
MPMIFSHGTDVCAARNSGDSLLAASPICRRLNATLSRRGSFAKNSCSETPAIRSSAR